MQIHEILEAPLSGWQRAQQDAAARGMTLEKSPHSKGYRLYPENYDQLAQQLEQRNFSWTDWSGVLMVTVNKLSDYKAAADEMSKIVGSVDKIADKLRMEKSTDSYKKLQNMQQQSLGKWPHGELQLYMPRPAVHKPTRNARWTYQYDDQGNIRESRPVLTGATADSPPGNNKPGNCFWTSSLKTAKEIDGKKYYTSDWAEWVAGNMPAWLSPRGHVYRISPNARILELNSTPDAQEIYQLYADMGSAVKLHDVWSGNEIKYQMMNDFPWQDIRKHWDAVCHSSEWDRSGFTYGWDCESTAWFNTDVLTYVGEVAILPRHSSEQNR